MIEPALLLEIRHPRNIVGFDGRSPIYRVNVRAAVMERATELAAECIGPVWSIKEATAPNGVPSYLIYTPKPEWFVEIEMQVKGIT